MRKCRYCRAELPRVKDCTDGYQKAGFCDVDHMAKYAMEKDRLNKEKKARAGLKGRKEKIKTRSDRMREAQTEFNRWVRLRDHGKPCVSCDRPDDGSHQRHASHYRSRGAHPELAFEPLNVHSSCAQCNNCLSGNIVEFRIRLINRIGLASLSWLEGPHKPKKYTEEELIEIKLRYRREANKLKKSIEST